MKILSGALGGFLAGMIFFGIKALLSKGRGTAEPVKTSWKCPQCGAENASSDGVCPHCGEMKPRA